MKKEEEGGHREQHGLPQQDDCPAKGERLLLECDHLRQQLADVQLHHQEVEDNLQKFIYNIVKDKQQRARHQQLRSNIATKQFNTLTYHNIIIKHMDHHQQAQVEHLHYHYQELQVEHQAQHQEVQAQQCTQHGGVQVEHPHVLSLAKNYVPRLECQTTVKGDKR